MNNQRLTLTVGITTCYGHESILDTVRSLRSSTNVDPFRLIIVADRVPIKPALRQALEALGVELIENSDVGSQFKKQKQIISQCNSDLILFTQDDVLFEPHALSTIVATFANEPKTTFISIRNQPIPATTRFETAVNIGTELVNTVSGAWNGGDNYLSVIARCMAFRTDWVQHNMALPDEVVSTDAYRYFEHKKTGGVYHYLPTVAVFFKNPQNMAEHLRKSSRFQHSQLEMSHYFGDLRHEYTVPKRVVIQALLKHLVAHPLLFMRYSLIYGYTRWMKTDPKTTLNANWEVDTSTKQLTV